MTHQPPPADDTDRPPPYHAPYGQAPGTPPPPGYGQPPGDPHYGHAPPPGSPPPPGGPRQGGPQPGQPYDRHWGYGPPGVPAHPGEEAPASGDETTWAMMSYLGAIIVSLIAPLVIYFVKRHESVFVRYHAAQALNYMLTTLIHMVVVAAICVPPAIMLESPVFLAPLILAYLVDGLGQWVFLILGAVKAGKGAYYRFPTFFCFRMVR